MKRCNKCGQVKDESEFHRYANSDKPRARCKVCINEANLARQAANPEKYNARTYAWRAKNPGRTTANILAWRLRNPERYKSNVYWTQYRIDFAALWEAQDGKCAACCEPMLREGRDPTSVCADHDRSCCSGRRSCGKCVRGLIHWRCNLVLGYAKDSIEVLRSAVLYLEHWKTVGPQRFDVAPSVLPDLAPVDRGAPQMGVSRAWQIRNPERFKAQAYKSKYRLDFAALWKAQEGKCACCHGEMVHGNISSISSTVDHDRSCCPGKKSCGKCIRGLIHRNCNLVLGYAKDDIEVLCKVVDYLERRQIQFSSDTLAQATVES